MSERPAILVCALADGPRTVQGSTFKHKCAGCGRGLMIAPSGQRRLREIPDIVTLCGACYLQTVNVGDTIQGAGTVEELREEARTAKPNLRRHRN